MVEIILKNNNANAISLGSVNGEKDLKPRPIAVNINPPPEDVGCMCCGRHISELKPFSKAGDPLEGDFDGALLVKVFRPDCPYDEEAELAFKEAKNRYKDDEYEDILDWMINRHGKKKEKNIFIHRHCKTPLGQHGCAGIV